MTTPDSTIHTPLQWIFKTLQKVPTTLFESHATQQHSESARERRKALYKSDQQLELDLGQQETSEKHIMQYLMTVDHSIISWMLFY